VFSDRVLTELYICYIYYIWLRWSRGSVLAFSTEVCGFLGRKNPQHAFLRRESKAHVVDLRHVKDP